MFSVRSEKNNVSEKTSAEFVHPHETGKKNYFIVFNCVIYLLSCLIVISLLYKTSTDIPKFKFVGFSPTDIVKALKTSALP